ncbi:hypothetical protein DU508_21880 [Pedobacter chinensis]|uniref:Uncharacterized protein n=1 Tax=Pedobacter chinensis TaxID=2282421 RepID=A0A369PP47_9SPHI|nr:hypothetical protein DU508_21880 [Pedobacter chinensis]
MQLKAYGKNSSITNSLLFGFSKGKLNSAPKRTNTELMVSFTILVFYEPAFKRSFIKKDNV